VFNAIKIRAALALAGSLAVLAPIRGLAQERAGESRATVVFSLAPTPEPQSVFPSLRDAWNTREAFLSASPSVRLDPVTVRNFSFAAAGRDFLSDAVRIWTYPFDIKSGDLVPIGLIAVTAAVLISNDRNFNGIMTRNVVDGDGDDKFSPLMSQMGSYGAWGTVGAFLAFGALAKDNKAMETAGLAASAMLQTELVIHVGKMISGRLRPGSEGALDTWAGPAGFFKSGQSPSYDSFPSGHTATAFSLATVVAMQYSGHTWAPIAAYAIAAGVGFSRLSGNHHWLSDVVIGGVVGHLIARTVVKNYRKRHGIQPILAVGRGGVTVGASYEFR
jgi:membrane-associated phospholipid phosphatase